MSVLATEPGLETGREAIAPRVDADAPLLEALRRRDPSAAERLVASFGDRAYRLAFPSRRIELRVALTTAMADLPADYHTVVLWHDAEGLSAAEIAAALGISIANVTA